MEKDDRRLEKKKKAKMEKGREKKSKRIQNKDCLGSPRQGIIWFC